MRLGARLPRALAVAAVAAVTVIPLAASSASAAPVAPTAYTVYGSAAPLTWDGSSSLPVGDFHVPFVVGKTNNAAVASAKAYLAPPDGNPTTMSGDSINGLTCAGYPDAAKTCKDPFLPQALVSTTGVDGRHVEQAASFTGRDGKFPGSIRALNECPGNCGVQLAHSLGSASGPAGVLPGYVSIGSSQAGFDTALDDKGRLVSTATSELDNVSIGPKNEVHFSKLVTTAQAIGAGADNTKDGRPDIRISDFYILDNPVELTRAGLRLANGGPSEQEAYDGAKVLLKKLKDRGITLELPNFDSQLAKTADHVIVDTAGLRVRFEQSVGNVNASTSTLSNPLELGHSTAVVVALDVQRKTDVQESKGGGVVVQTTAPASPTTEANGGRTPDAKPARGNGAGSAQPGPTRGTPANGGERQNPTTTETPGVSASQPTPSTSGEAVASPAPTDESQPAVGESTGTDLNTPDNVAIGLKDIERNLGLRDAHSVSRAFGAFLGLGLILPLARFLIRRLG
ncbi:MAG TPA: hypothetical protein VHL53_02980 [Acidimicrobiia bacterium]|nr:hypothetical protein [Acidimicrobiia bacterium]